MIGPRSRLAGLAARRRPRRRARGRLRRRRRGDRRRRDRRRRLRALKVGLVADAGQLNDNGFNELAYKGLKRAERELGIKGRVVESKSAADYVPNMSTLARQGYDLIIGVGFAQGDAIAADREAVPRDEVRDRRRRPGLPQGQAGERAGAALPRGAGRLPRRLPRRRSRRSARAPTRSAPSAASRSRRSTGSSPATRPAPRRRCRARRCAGLLAGLGRPGEVQGAGAQPDRGRLEGGLPGRRRVRARRALRGEGRGGVGDRRRRRPVVPRPARPDERAQGRRQRGLPHDRLGRGRDFAGGRNAVFGLDQEGRRARHGQPEGERRRRREGRGGSSRRSPTARSATSRRRWGAGNLRSSRWPADLVRPRTTGSR